MRRSPSCNRCVRTRATPCASSLLSPSTHQAPRAACETPSSACKAERIRHESPPPGIKGGYGGADDDIGVDDGSRGICMRRSERCGGFVTFVGGSIETSGVLNVSCWPRHARDNSQKRLIVLIRGIETRQDKDEFGFYLFDEAGNQCNVFVLFALRYQLHRSCTKTGTHFERG